MFTTNKVEETKEEKKDENTILTSSKYKSVLPTTIYPEESSFSAIDKLLGPIYCSHKLRSLRQRRSGYCLQPGGLSNPFCDCS